MLCCNLCRSPSWPVWAPRLPTLSQNECYNSQVNCDINDSFQSPISNLTLIDPTSNRFWLSASPLSSRKNQRISMPIVKLNNTISENVKAKKIINNGLNNNRVMNNNDTSVVFKVPGVVQDLSKHSGKIIPTIDNDLVVKMTNKNVNNSGLIINRPRIGQPSWRNISKTCDCIEKGKTSPVLKLADQARAISSPDPLHRPETPRASSFISAGAAQSLR